MDVIEPSFALAAIVHAGKGSADAVLLGFAQRLSEQGLVVRGLVPGPQADPGDCAARTVRDLEIGDIYPIGQNLGKQSGACCLDPGALLAAGVVLRRALEGPADLVIVNRFGIQEAAGDGFCAEFLELITRGYPLLTVVSHTYLPAWREFTGGMATELSADAEALLAWFERIRNRPPTAAAPSASA